MHHSRIYAIVIGLLVLGCSREPEPVSERETRQCAGYLISFPSDQIAEVRANAKFLTIEYSNGETFEVWPYPASERREAYPSSWVPFAGEGRMPEVEYYAWIFGSTRYTAIRQIPGQDLVVAIGFYPSTPQDPPLDWGPVLGRLHWGLRNIGIHQAGPPPDPLP